MVHSTDNTCEGMIKKECKIITHCGLLFATIQARCQTILGKDYSTCSNECRSAVRQLVNLPIGKKLVTCQCRNELNCLVFRNRFDRCLNGTAIARKRSCTNITKRCMKKTLCKKKYEQYFVDCQGLFNGYECTQKCIDSTREFYKFKLGKKTVGDRMRKCHCDGSLETERSCYEIRKNTNRLCPAKWNKVK